MNELKFNSQVCTTREQSQRLLELGLNLYTSDMCWLNVSDLPACAGYIVFEKAADEYKMNIIPAWSLHRLIDLLPKVIYINSKQWYLSITPYYNNMVAYEHCGFYEARYLYKGSYDDVYNNIINCIEWLINEGYFNKEYLKQ